MRLSQDINESTEELTFDEDREFLDGEFIRVGCEVMEVYLQDGGVRFRRGQLGTSASIHLAGAEVYHLGLSSRAATRQGLDLYLVDGVGLRWMKS